MHCGLSRSVTLTVAFLSSLNGCGRAFTLDGDAAVMADAAPPLRDAAPSPDTGTCSGVAWLDRAPLVRGIDTSAPPALAAGRDGFVAITTYLDHDAWWYWVVVDRLPLVGDPTSSQGARFFGEQLRDHAPRLFASADPSGRVHVAAAGETHLWWTAGPDWDRADGSAPLERSLGSVAFENAATLVHTYQPDVDESGRLPRDRAADGAVTRFRSEGVAPEGVALDPAIGGSFWDPRLAVTSDGPWLAIVNDVDFPPTVQLAGPSGGAWDGSSCGVESYDFLAESGTDVVVAEDCGATVRVERRSTRGERHGADLSGRASGAAGSRIATNGDRLVVAHWGADGAAHVTILDHALATVATDVVPGSVTTTEHRAGSLAVAAASDGTYAVLVATADGGTTSGEATIQRFRACDR